MKKLWLPKPHLSISQIKLYKMCPRRYYNQYLEKRSSITPHLTGGSAAHEALETNYLHYIEHGEYMNTEAIVAKFKEVFERDKHEITDWSKLTEAEAISILEHQIRLHMAGLAPRLNAVTTESSIEEYFDGIKVVGFVDLEEEDTILDHKFRFAFNKPQLDPHTDPQLTLYALSKKKKKAGFIFHWLVEKTVAVNKVYGRPYAAPACGIYTSTRNQKDFDGLNDLVVGTAKSIDANYDAGDFPRVAVKECPRWCEFRDECWGREASKTASNMRANIYKIKNGGNLVKSLVDELDAISVDPVSDVIPF